jgi:AAA15 family ATPase/GTPase
MNAEQPKSALLENIAYPTKENLGVFKTAGIYGANASGKSNVLRAFRALQWIVEESGDLKEDSKIPCYEPHRLSKSGQTDSISFEVEFVGPKNLRHVYAISFNQFEILEESLDFYPTRQKANLFKRSASDTWNTISFGGYYKGGTKRFPLFKNNSYLSKAGNNASAPPSVRWVYNYFRNLIIFGFNMKISVSEIFEDDKLLKRTADLLGLFDTGIIEITKKESKRDPAKYLPAGISEDFKNEIIKMNKYDFMFAHQKDDGELIYFREIDESDGTQKLFNILPAIIAALDAGSILIIDELDNSFHPHIAELIIKLFNDPQSNKNNAQLIFTTHNISLMSHKILRRDQIWFTEKTDGLSKLYSLDEFDKSTVKMNSPFGQWYDEGRFGAVPHLNYTGIVEVLTREDEDNEYSNDTVDALEVTSIEGESHA